MCSRGEPSDCEVVFFFYARVTSWLHMWFGIRQEGVIPCRMVPSMWDEVHVQLRDVTGEVQPARLIIAAQRRVGRAALDARVAALDAHLNIK